MKSENLNNITSDSRQLPEIENLNGVTGKEKIHELFIDNLDILRDKENRTIRGITINSSYIGTELASQIENKDYLTENDIASLADATYQAVNNWYNKNYFPKTYNLAVLAKSFNVTMEWLLGTSNIMSYTSEQAPIEEHKVFKKYGINETAFYSLCQLKAEDIDLQEYLSSINYILAHIATKSGKPSLPVVNALNIFFDMYDTGMNVRFSSEKLKSILKTLEKKSDTGTLTAADYEYALSRSSFQESPVYIDEVNLDIVGTELKRCKGRWVKGKIDVLEELLSNDTNSPSQNEINQLNALQNLDEYYNDSAEK